MNEVIKMDETAKKRYAVWTVNGKEYRLKLSTMAIVALEEQMGGNLLNVFSSGGVPKLKDMLNITYRAIKTYEPEIRVETVCDLFDDYVDAGGSQTEFLAGPFMDIFKVSGFFTKQTENVVEARQEKLAKIL